MKEDSEVIKFYHRKEQQRKARAQRPVSEKLAIASRLRDVQERLAPARAANKAKRASGKIEIRIKTA
jgi:tetrahydromethanopterin S-methyltransferase subunit A